MNILLLNWLTVAIAIAAFTYSNIITEPGQILSRVFVFLERRLPEWLFKPLMGCQYCVSGQWSLWFYLYMCFFLGWTEYHWFFHIWFILQTIFAAYIVTFLYYTVMNQESKKEEPKEDIIDKPNDNIFNKQL